MEKDSSSHDSDSDDCSNSQESQMSGKPKDTHTVLISDEVARLREKQRNLMENLKRLEENHVRHIQALSVLENISFRNRNPDIESSKDRNVPALENLQDIFDDIVGNVGYSDTFLPPPTQESSTLPDSILATAIAEQPWIVSSEPSQALSFLDTHQSSLTALEDISVVREDIYANLSSLISPLSPDNSAVDLLSSDKTLETRTSIDLKDAEPQSPDKHFKIPQPANRSELNESGGCSGGKGKEAANIKFRYKKKSKSESSFSESSGNVTPVKDSKIPFGTPDFKKLVLESPEATFSNSSSAEKRKGLYLSEKDDNQESDEGCAIDALKSPRNYANYGSKVVKKLKFEEAKSSDCSQISIAALSHLTEQDVDKNVVMSKFIGQLQVDQIPKESDELILPSTSGTSKEIVSKNFSSTDDSRSTETSVKDEVIDSSLGESTVACLENVNTNLLSERRDTPSVNAEVDLTFSSKEESANSDAS